MIYPDKIVRTKRKTLALVINDDAQLIVRAPIKCSDGRITKFILQKEDWIRSKQAQVKEASKLDERLTLTEGEIVHLLGEEYTIRLVNNGRCRISGDSIYLPQDNKREKFIRLMMKELKRIVEPRVKHFSQLLDVKCAKISINRAKTRWGSCSAKNVVHFTYRLIFTNAQVLDYIVVHELCHILQKNHSVKFWTLVGGIMPEYKEQEKYLKVHRNIMNMI